MAEKLTEYGMMKFFIGIMLALLGAGIAQIAMSATLVEKMNNAQHQIDAINKDYVPMFVVSAIVESNYYRSDEIMAILQNNPEAVKEIQKKYSEFQLGLTKIISSRRGMQVTPTSYSDEDK